MVTPFMEESIKYNLNHFFIDNLHCLFHVLVLLILIKIKDSRF